MSVDALFQPLTLGSLELPNRIVMAPLTRGRASKDNVPQPVMAEYYAQRAAAGLIVSEATAVHPIGMGWYRVPGIWSDEQIAGWQGVTGAVHEAGGRIFCQIWHMGRLVLPDYIGGKQPIAPSAIAAEGETLAPRPAGDDSLFLPMKPYVTPREMTRADIDEAVAAYGKGAANALKAGFDGVEIHGANGYLIDQFLTSSTNRRTDDYGGSLHNRLRFLREVIAAVVAQIEPGRVGLRISPTSKRKGMEDADPGALAAAVGRIADEAGFAYIHLIEPIAAGFMDVPDDPVMERLRATYRGAVIQNGGFDAEKGADFIARGAAEAISFGRPFMANPDLVARFREGHPLAEVDFDYAYVGDEKGYTDYPTCAEVQAAE